MRILIAAAALALLLAVASPAAADVEPNNGIVQPEGPIAGATAYSGTLASANDDDWYVFYVASQTQLDIAFTTQGSSPCSMGATFRDADGEHVDAAYATVNATDHILYTTPVGVNRYYLAVDYGCARATYRFQVDPGAAIVAGPATTAPQPTSEPNETADQAFGPLVGGTPYAARIDTQNDEDWFYFFTGGATALDVALTGTGGDCSPDAQLYAASNLDSTLSSTSIYENQTSHMSYSAGGPAKFLVRVDDLCTGGEYQLRVDPAPALVAALPALAPPAPSGPSSRCLRARRGVKRWRSAVRRTRAKLAVVSTRHARKALKRKLAAQRRTLRRAHDRVTIYCT